MKELFLLYFLPLLLSLFYFKVMYSKVGKDADKQWEFIDTVMCITPFANIIMSLGWIFRFPVK